MLGEADKSMHLTLTCFSEVRLLQEDPGGVAAGVPRYLSDDEGLGCESLLPL